jgi:hypothetical protein
MQNDANLSIPTPKRAPWNKGRLIGAKPPLQQKHVWAIRGMLQNERNKRDLAMFNLAIDSKLRGCDVVTIKVDDIAPNGYAINRATTRVGLVHRCRARPSFIRYALIARN